MHDRHCDQNALRLAYTHLRRKLAQELVGCWQEAETLSSAARMALVAPFRSHRRHAPAKLP